MSYEFILSQFFSAIEISEDKNKDLVTMAAWLNNKDLMDEALSKLNQILTSDAAKLNLLSDDIQQGLKDYLPGIAFKHNKLLSIFFKQWAAENEFTEIKIFREALLPDDFLKNIHSGALFKDVGRGDREHGEWSHIIQWYCICEINKRERQLQNSPVALLKFLGTSNTVMVQVWMMLFENGAGFSNVNTLNQYIISNSFRNRCPVLHQLILGRLMRREEKCQNRDIKDYPERRTLKA